MIPLVAIGGGMLTLLVFVVLALFGVGAWFSLRKHIRGIEVPSAAEGGMSLDDDPVTPASPEVAAGGTSA